MNEDPLPHPPLVNRGISLMPRGSGKENGNDYSGFRDITPVVENQVEKQKETGLIFGPVCTVGKAWGVLA